MKKYFGIPFIKQGAIFDWFNIITFTVIFTILWVIQ